MGWNKIKQNTGMSSERIGRGCASCACIWDGIELRDGIGEGTHGVG